MPRIKLRFEHQLLQRISIEIQAILDEFQDIHHLDESDARMESIRDRIQRKQPTACVVAGSVRHAMK